ncbi:MAG: NADH-quinone oxidoreductase subunit N [Anaerolineales bacterium]
MTLTDLLLNMKVVLPTAVLIAWSCVLLLADLFIPKGRKGWTALLAALGLVLFLGLSITQGGQAAAGFNRMVIYDGFSFFLNILFLSSGLVGIALAFDYIKRLDIERGEYYVLLLFSISGMMLMAQANDLIVVFLALELLSIPLYVLAGFARPRMESEEASLKYFLMGAFAGGFVVFGVALVFGATGTTNLSEIFNAINKNLANLPLLTVGAALILVGLGFKVAAVPFHMWTPDVYQGAPSAVSAFMSVGAKAGGFAALLRIFISAFPSLSTDLTMILWTISALTMFLGNVVAIAQSNIKRLLAYSSIAHAGYILMALVPYGNTAVSADTVSAALFYLVAYALTSFGAWAVVIAVEKVEGQGLALDDYAGLARKYPLLAASMAVFMLSFTGIPPTLGFMGKFYLFRTVIQGGYLGLALIGVFTSLISAYYYLRVIVIMYMREGEPVARKEFWVQFTAAATAVLVIALSLAAGPLLNLASKAVLLTF